MRLLLVEDDAMIGEALRTGLRRDGFAVDWVRDGDSAVFGIRRGRSREDAKGREGDLI